MEKNFNPKNLQMPPETPVNPLKQYFRSIKMYLKLPSGTSYYTPDVIEFTDSGEVGIMPMTGKDELVLKNPDALLNGEALVEVLTSCVPSLKNPKALLTNDIDALITGIRYITFNDALETDIKCPSCGTDNNYRLNLEDTINRMEFLEPNYVVNLESGVSVFVKPYGFTEILKSLHADFERGKIAKIIETKELSDTERANLFGQAFKELAFTRFDLLVGGIIKVVDESNNVDVSDKKFIKEFLQNIDKKSVDKISDLITKINQIGIKRTFIAKCTKCEHEWESGIDFNPVNFS